MRLSTKDRKRSVDIGGSDIWLSLYSTVEIRLGTFKKSIPNVINFLETGKCDPKDALNCARQFNLLRDELSKYRPDQVIYDLNNLTKEAPWKEDLSPVVTSIANLYTTTDGKDLLFEIVSILTYSYYTREEIIVEQG